MLGELLVELGDGVVVPWHTPAYRPWDTDQSTSTVGSFSALFVSMSGARTRRAPDARCPRSPAKSPTPEAPRL